MKIEPEFVLALQREIASQRGQAAVAEAEAKEAAEKAQATFQQAIGGLAVLQAIAGKLNEPETVPVAEPVFTPEQAEHYSRDARRDARFSFVEGALQQEHGPDENKQPGNLA